MSALNTFPFQACFKNPCCHLTTETVKPVQPEWVAWAALLQREIQSSDSSGAKVDSGSWYHWYTLYFRRLLGLNIFLGFFHLQGIFNVLVILLVQMCSWMMLMCRKLPRRSFSLSESVEHGLDEPPFRALPALQLLRILKTTRLAPHPSAVKAVTFG